jgi:23S rRNA C2498 (ribose-2'-O)-methylase RlmM
VLTCSLFNTLGGWTKYLLEKTHCDEVYAIDPGNMEESITSSVNVHHLQMTAQNAIPQLRDILTRRKAKVSIWVSDMCVQDVGKQVDIFLLAYKETLIETGTAFVLTIKCNVGHAKERFDEMANVEAARLKEKVDVSGLEILHLFSNRIGERTIIGCVK